MPETLINIAEYQLIKFLTPLKVYEGGGTINNINHYKTLQDQKIWGMKEKVRNQFQ